MQLVMHLINTRLGAVMRETTNNENVPIGHPQLAFAAHTRVALVGHRSYRMQVLQPQLGVVR